MTNCGWNLKHTYTGLPEIFYRYHKPVAAVNPKMVIFNRELAAELGLDPDSPCERLFSGTELPAGAKPICQAYGGYQFGHFAMLGDGRAVMLGEQVTPAGSMFDIQLKGAGPTPFSRGGDGFAALLPMLREYIVSEAMHYLGIPTTRSLAVTLTGQPVLRDTVLPGAVLTRVAGSHVRVGTFNYAAAFGTKDDVQALADYCTRRHFPWLLEGRDGAALRRYELFFREVARRQAKLIAQWQLVGFIHGVMNTDNMSVCGETIDYGPCAFMDVYDPDTVFSSIDAGGRYAYKNQPGIGAWNLARLAEALLPLFDEDKKRAIEVAQEEIGGYWEAYEKCWLDGMREKLGLEGEEAGDAGLAEELLDLMYKHKLDFTNTFRRLSGVGKKREVLSEIVNHDSAIGECRVKPVVAGPIGSAKGALPGTPDFSAWLEKWTARRGGGQYDCVIDKHNPAVIPRNYHVEEALTAAGRGDYGVMKDLLAALRRPFEDGGVYAAVPVAGSCEYKTFCGT
ncbi:MAG: YdiU family protein [Defluviitaleaceae bacterium]|nr:YdiU family protein [Defluviitaleaceae bacterium]